MSLHPKPHRPVHWWISEEEKQWLLSMRAAKVCAEKKDYPTYEATLRVAIYNTTKSPDTPRLRVYRCPTCSNYHLTKASNHYEDRN